MGDEFFVQPFRHAGIIWQKSSGRSNGAATKNSAEERK
jgi:hypothetical protein